MKITGNLIDIFNREIYPADITVENGRIESIKKSRREAQGFLMPGLVDAHIHIESSMVTPGSFAGAAVSRGTTAVVSDPHEIANVLGVEGVRYMIADAAKVPLKFYFGAPSCVPATSFETSGAAISGNETGELLRIPEIKFLSEMMNWPGVINGDKEVMEKIGWAKIFGKPVDGHAPGLSGGDLRKYVSAGISTDHECSTMEEALEKIGLGMKVLIREGSAARNLNELKELIRLHPGKVMLCSDDLHPDMLMRGHIDRLAARLISEGYDLFDVIRSCTLNPDEHYSLGTGLMRPGDPADFIRVKDYRTMEVTATWIDGIMVFGENKVHFRYKGGEKINKFNCSEITAAEIAVLRNGSNMRVIEANDGKLLTNEIILKNDGPGYDIGADILKLVVKDRYNDSPPSVAFIKGFGLKTGAFAASIAHDSHNVIAAGTSDSDIADAANAVIRMNGGLAVATCGLVDSLPLDIAGIMSSQPLENVAAASEILTEKVRSLGCKMAAPFMTLSFMALLVIPALKLSDKGLFDGKQFRFVPLFFE